ncbi:MAG: MarR family transcriptional regulator [Pseudomonadota bacterium]
MNSKKHFKLQEFLPYLLNQAAETSSLAFQKTYKDRYGMLRAEWRVLFHLGLYGEMTAVEIGRRAQMHKTKISRAVHKLAERRFITRSRDLKDRRVEHLALTDRGKEAYRDLSKVAESYNAELEARLSDEEVDHLRSALEKLAKPVHG